MPDRHPRSAIQGGMITAASATLFTLRPTMLDDMPGALALANLCSQAVTGKDEFSIEDYRYKEDRNL